MQTWDKLVEEIIPEAELAEIRAEVARESLALDLKRIRETLGLTQVQAAELVKMTQSELSRFERRDDHRVSTLRRYVHALGGTLKIVAEVNDKTITLAEG